MQSETLKNYYNKHQYPSQYRRLIHNLNMFQITIVQALNLPNIGLNTAPSAYCSVKCADQTMYTDVVPNLRNPIWQSAFAFNQLHPIVITVYNSNPTDVDEVLGKIQIPIEELQTSKEFISDYYLDNKISKIKIKTQSSNSNQQIAPNSTIGVQVLGLKDSDQGMLTVKYKDKVSLIKAKNYPQNSDISFCYETGFNILTFQYTFQGQKQSFDSKFIDLQSLSPTKNNFRTIVLNNIHNNRPKTITCFIGFYSNNYESLGMKAFSVFVKSIKTTKEYLIKVKGALNHDIIRKDKPKSKIMLLQDKIVIQFFYNKDQRSEEQCKYLKPSITHVVHLSQLNWKQQGQNLWGICKPLVVENNHFQDIELQLQLQISKNCDQISLYKQTLKPSLTFDQELSLALQKVSLKNGYIHELMPNLDFCVLVKDSASNKFYSNIQKSDTYHFNINSEIICSSYTNFKIQVSLMSIIPFSQKETSIFKVQIDVKKLTNSNFIQVQGQFTPSFLKYSKKYILAHHQSTKNASKMINDNSVLLKLEYTSLKISKHQFYQIQIVNIIKNKGISISTRKLNILTSSSSNLIEDIRGCYLLEDSIMIRTESKEVVCFQLCSGKQVLISKYFGIQQFFGYQSGKFKKNFSLQSEQYQIYYNVLSSPKVRSNKVLSLPNTMKSQTYRIKLKNISIPAFKSFRIELQTSKTKYISKQYRGIDQSKLQFFDSEGGIFQFQNKAEKYLFCTLNLKSQKIQILNGYLNLDNRQLDGNNSIFCINLCSTKKGVDLTACLVIQITPLQNVYQSKLTIQSVVTEPHINNLFKQSSKYYISIDVDHISNLFEITPTAKLTTQNLIFLSNRTQTTLSNINDIKLNQKMIVNQVIQLKKQCSIKILSIENIEELKNGKSKYQTVAQGYLDIRQIQHQKINYAVKLTQIHTQDQKIKYKDFARIVDSIWIIFDCQHQVSDLSTTKAVPIEFVPKVFTQSVINNIIVPQNVILQNKESSISINQNSRKLIKFYQHLYNYPSIWFGYKSQSFQNQNNLKLKLRNLGTKSSQRLITFLQFLSFFGKLQIKFWSNRITQDPNGTFILSKIVASSGLNSIQTFSIYETSSDDFTVTHFNNKYIFPIQGLNKMYRSKYSSSSNLLNSPISIPISSINSKFIVTFQQADSIIAVLQILLQQLPIQKLSSQPFEKAFDSDLGKITISGNYTSHFLGKNQSLKVQYFKNNIPKVVQHTDLGIVNFINKNSAITEFKQDSGLLKYLKIKINQQRIKFQRYLQNVKLIFDKNGETVLNIPEDSVNVKYQKNNCIISLGIFQGIIIDYPQILRIRYQNVQKKDCQIVGRNVDKNDQIGRFLFDNGQFVSVSFSTFSGRKLPSKAIFQLHLHRLMRINNNIVSIETLPNDEVLTKSFKIFLQYNGQFNVSSRISNKGIFKQFQTQTYGYNPEADVITFKLIIDNCLNQNIQFDYDGDWIKEMPICKGTLSLNQMMSSAKNMYFWVQMQECKVGEISIASSFQKIFKRDSIFLFGQIKMIEQSWGFVNISLGKIFNLPEDEQTLIWVQMQVIDSVSKEIVKRFNTDYVKRNQSVLFREKDFWVRIISPHKHFLKVVFKSFQNGKKISIGEKRIQLIDILNLNENQVFKIQIKTEESKFQKPFYVDLTISKSFKPPSIQKQLVEQSAIDIGDFRKASDAELIRVLVSSVKRTHMFETLAEIKQSLIYVASDRSMLIRTLFYYLLVYKSPQIVRVVSQCISLSFLRTKDPFANIQNFNLYESIKNCTRQPKIAQQSKLKLQEILSQSNWDQLYNFIILSKQEKDSLQSEAIKYILDFALTLMRKFPKFLQDYSSDIIYWIELLESYPALEALSSFKNTLLFIYNSNIKKYGKETLEFIMKYSIPKTEELSFYLYLDTKPNDSYFKYLVSLIEKPRTLSLYNAISMYIEQEDLDGIKSNFDTRFFNKLQQDIRRGILNKDKDLIKKILGIISQLKNKGEIEIALYKNVVDLCSKQQKYAQGEIKLIFQNFNRLHQQKSGVVKRAVNKKVDSSKFLISKLDY